jgi:hypothetical protein
MRQSRNKQTTTDESDVRGPSAQIRVYIALLTHSNGGVDQSTSVCYCKGTVGIILWELHRNLVYVLTASFFCSSFSFAFSSFSFFL